MSSNGPRGLGRWLGIIHNAYPVDNAAQVGESSSGRRPGDAGDGGLPPAAPDAQPDQRQRGE